MIIYACKQAGYAEKMADVWEKLAEETERLWKIAAEVFGCKFLFFELSFLLLPVIHVCSSWNVQQALYHLLIWVGHYLHCHFLMSKNLFLKDYWIFYTGSLLEVTVLAFCSGPGNLKLPKMFCKWGTLFKIYRTK